MVDSLKILGQVVPSSNVLVDLYTVPPGIQTSISSITICNQDITDITFSITVAPGGAADDPKHYIYKNLPLYLADTFIATVGLSLTSTDVVRVSTTSASVSFNIFGVEVS